MWRNSKLDVEGEGERLPPVTVRVRRTCNVQQTSLSGFAFGLRCLHTGDSIRMLTVQLFSAAEITDQLAIACTSTPVRSLLDLSAAHLLNAAT